MTNENKNNLISQYLDNISRQANSNYPKLIDDSKLRRAKEMFLNSSNDYEAIVKQINEIIERLIEERKMIVENMKLKSSDELVQYTLNLEVEKKGLYLSQLQIDLLMITELSSMEELKNYFQTCPQFANIKLESIIDNYDSIDLESAKRKLYDAYLSTLDNYTDEAQMTNDERIMSKISKMGIYGAEQIEIMNYLKTNGLNETIQYLKNEKGNDFVIKLNRVIKDDFENVKSVSYDDMLALSRLIDRDDSIDSLIIATSKYDNIMFSNGTEMYFDPYFTDKALQYCAKHNLHMRYHALFDYVHIEKLLAAGKGMANKEEILSNMKKFVELSMQYIDENNRTLSDGTQLINVVEVFNELVEKNKLGNDKNSPYEMKWEKEFGITVQDLIECFNDVKKPNGVEFMYNETTLTESRKKRDKVESVIGQIESISPGFIDAFGDQSHLSEEDLKNDGIEIKETAEMLCRIQNGKIRTGVDLAGNYLLTSIDPKKVEMTEHDFHFTKDFIEVINEASSKQVIGPYPFEIIKKNMQEQIAMIYKDSGVNFDHVTYWSLFNKCDHNLVRANEKIIKENKGKEFVEPLIDDMFAGTLGSGKEINKIKSLSQNFKRKEKIQTDDLSSNQQTQLFSSRSESEIQIARQIREKNQLISDQKHIAQQQERGKTLVRKINSSNNGTVNLISLSLIVIFIVIILFIAIYFIIKL